MACLAVSPSSLLLPFEVGVLVPSEWETLPSRGHRALLIDVPSLFDSAFCIPLGQMIASAVGAGFQNVTHGWRMLCK